MKVRAPFIVRAHRHARFTKWFLLSFGLHEVSHFERDGSPTGKWVYSRKWGYGNAVKIRDTRQ